MNVVLDLCGQIVLSKSSIMWAVSNFYVTGVAGRGLCTGNAAVDLMLHHVREVWLSYI